ncbi:MAG: hypothetical protein ABWZ98_06130 [Nakamurella sp.]
MTERYIRLSAAGLLLLRGTAAIGGIFGAYFWVAALTGQQRLIFMLLVGAVAMPVVLMGLMEPLRWGTATVIGLALTNAVIFVDPAAYLALAFVAVVGGLLMVGTRVSLRSSRGRPSY